MLDQQALLQIQLEKLYREVEAAKRLLAKKIDPLLAADDLMAATFMLAEEGLKAQFPPLSDKEILQMMRDQFLTGIKRPRSN